MYIPFHSFQDQIHKKHIRGLIWPCRKIGKVQLAQGYNLKDVIVLEHSMLHTNFQGHRPFGSKEEDFLRFYHIWAWRLSRSCDLDLSFSQPMETPYEIWLWLAKRFLRRKCLKIVVDMRTTTDKWRQRPTYPISSPVSIRLSWVKNVKNKKLFYLKCNCIQPLFKRKYRFSRRWFFKKHKFPNFLLRIHILRAYNCIRNCLGIFQSGCFQQCCCGCCGVWRRLIEGKLVLRSKRIINLFESCFCRYLKV